tara:strand:+ start:414 stop:545 length:132 start_codon:yes stop_codon:yes gene_type:complete
MNEITLFTQWSGDGHEKTEHREEKNSQYQNFVGYHQEATHGIE